MLRIVDWQKHFENNRTRELQKLSWVPFPNKHDGDGYTELLAHKDGASHYGAWCALVQVASKCDPRGTLVRDGAKPHTAVTLSRMTRISEGVLAAAIKRLIDEIGWLENVTEDGSPIELNCVPHLGAVLESQGSAALQNGREGKEWKGTEGKEWAPPDDLFEEFWRAYPSGRKTGKQLARKAWAIAIKKENPENIIRAAIEYSQSPVADGDFVKGPAPWLNQGCWDDDRAAWYRQPSENGQHKRGPVPMLPITDGSDR